MINSRDPDKLIPSVAKNCKALLAACAVAGFNAGLSCTYRDQEYQTYLHATKGAPRLVSFHGAGLAFDVYENLNGKTSYRQEFFDFVAPLAKRMGFTWMQDITHADKPHFQWDDARKYSGSMVRAGKIPRAMPLYKAPAAIPTAVLRKGSKGDDVRDLQTRLNARLFPCGKVDGDFGPRTLEAVKAFQAARGLVVDGVVGKMTWGALYN